MSSTPAATTSRKSTYVYLVAAIAGLSGLLFGFDTAVINGALPFLRHEFRLTDVQVELIAGVLLFGCIAGAALTSVVSDRFGRRRALIVCAIVFAAASIASAVPRAVGPLALARFAAGLAIGLASALAPMYIAEVAPPSARGRLVSINQLAIVSGILVAYYVNWQFASAGEGNWRWMFAIAAVPSVAFWAGLMAIPESPRWLASRGDEPGALSVLNRVAEQSAQQELIAIRRSLTEESHALSALFQRGLRRPMILAIVLAFLGQATGINTIIYYGSILLREHAGQSTSAAVGANVLIGVINFAGTVVALLTIDRIGRRALLLFGAAGMCVSLVALGFAFKSQPQPYGLIVGCILAYVFCFAASFGPGVWVYISEIFPTPVRGRAVGIATVAVWVACLIVTLTFLSLIQLAGTAGAFWVYAALCGTAFGFVWLALPETKGRTLEQIQEYWR